MLTVEASVWVAALDARDRFHAVSVDFLRAVGKRGIQLHGPAFALLETACAVARRAGSVEAGQRAWEHLRRHPTLVLHPLSRRLMEAAREVGLQGLLRGADALYAAVALSARAPLVSWDEELLGRAGAITPERWLDRAGAVGRGHG